MNSENNPHGGVESSLVRRLLNSMIHRKAFTGDEKASQGSKKPAVEEGTIMLDRKAMLDGNMTITVGTNGGAGESNKEVAEKNAAKKTYSDRYSERNKFLKQQQLESCVSKIRSRFGQESICLAAHMEVPDGRRKKGRIAAKQEMKQSRVETVQKSAETTFPEAVTGTEVMMLCEALRRKANASVPNAETVRSSTEMVRTNAAKLQEGAI